MKVLGFSTSLYGWTERFRRDGLAQDWHSLCEACAEAGLGAVETDPRPEKLAVARSFGLAVSASYLGLPLHLPFERLEVERTVLPVAERLAAAGGRQLILNADSAPGEGRFAKTQAQGEQQGENLSRVAQLVDGLGLAVSMHNHADQPHNAQVDLMSVVRYADPAVGLCIDTGWAHVAGCAPVAWVRDHPQRLRSFHLRNQRGAIPTEDLLDGDIDIAELLRTAAGAGYEGWLTLELWHPQTMAPACTMVQDVRRSIDYLREVAASSA